MFTFLKKFFSSSKNNIISKTNTMPKINEVWYLKSKDRSPWQKKKIYSVTVLDVKGGWVRYKIGNGSIFDDERLNIKDFLMIYYKKEDHTGVSK